MHPAASRICSNSENDSSISSSWTSPLTARTTAYGRYPRTIKMLWSSSSAAVTVAAAQIARTFLRGRPTIANAATRSPSAAMTHQIVTTTPGIGSIERPNVSASLAKGFGLPDNSALIADAAKARPANTGSVRCNDFGIDQSSEFPAQSTSPTGVFVLTLTGDAGIPDPPENALARHGRTHSTPQNRYSSTGPVAPSQPPVPSSKTQSSSSFLRHELREDATISD